MTDRRTQIADAGVRILGSRGARALTHLAVDHELGLAEGSTSYYARTRRDLIGLIIERLSARMVEEMEAPRWPPALTPQSAARMVVARLDATMRRADDHRARLVLLLECHHDPELHASLAVRPQVRSTFVETAADLLRHLGVERPEACALDLAGLVDGLLMQRIIRTATIDEESIIAAYLTGLPRRTPTAP